MIVIKIQLDKLKGFNILRCQRSTQNIIKMLKTPKLILEVRRLDLQYAEFNCYENVHRKKCEIKNHKNKSGYSIII